RARHGTEAAWVRRRGLLLPLGEGKGEGATHAAPPKVTPSSCPPPRGRRTASRPSLARRPSPPTRSTTARRPSRPPKKARRSSCEAVGGEAGWGTIGRYRFLISVSAVTWHSRRAGTIVTSRGRPDLPGRRASYASSAHAAPRPVRPRRAPAGRRRRARGGDPAVQPARPGA